MAQGGQNSFGCWQHKKKKTSCDFPWDPFQAQDIKFGAYCLSNLGWFGGVSGNHSIFKLVVFHGVPGSGVTVAGPLGGVGEGVARSP